MQIQTAIARYGLRVGAVYIALYMGKHMRIAAQIAALVATLITIAWEIYKTGLDSAAAEAAAVAA